MLRLECPRRLLLRNYFSTAWLSSCSARCFTSVGGNESVASSPKESHHGLAEQGYQRDSNGDEGQYAVYRSLKTGEETLIPIQVKTGAVDRRRVQSEEEYSQLKWKLRKLRTWQRRQQVAQAHRENPDLAVAEARNQRLQYEQELCGEFLRRRLSGGMAVQSLVFDPEDCNVDDAVATAEACLAPEGGFLDLPRYAIECQWDPCLSSRPSPSPSSSALSSERGDDDANNVYVSREERNATRVASEITRFVRFIRERHDKVFLALTSLRRDSLLWNCLKRFHQAHRWNRVLVTELSAAELMGADNLERRGNGVPFAVVVSITNQIILSPDAELSLVDVDLGPGYPLRRTSADRAIDQNVRELMRSELREKRSKSRPAPISAENLASFQQYRAQLRPKIVDKVTRKSRERAAKREEEQDVSELIPDVVIPPSSSSPRRTQSAPAPKAAVVHDPIAQQFLLGRSANPHKCLVVGAIRAQGPPKLIGSTASLADQWGCTAVRLPIPEVLGPYLYAMSGYITEEEKNMVMSRNSSLEYFLYRRRHDIPLDVVLKTLLYVVSRAKATNGSSESGNESDLSKYDQEQSPPCSHVEDAGKDSAEDAYKSSLSGMWCEALLPLVPNRFLPEDLEQRQRPPPPGEESVWRRSLETPRPRISTTWQKYFSLRRRKMWVPPTIIRLIENPERTVSDQYVASINKNRFPNPRNVPRGCAGAQTESKPGSTNAGL